ncbi:39S ribosomal protein L10, mitochondrial [Caerostris darwini]|uniref:Large ribosomal subunit protein uL10m n=1 Tax=Caerostris darwini TaxID=1538125 RepID=A0AAV4WS50_9ARAC|nr:39S ribosomal protein L10, mitochondrial [Caerostris darwini]
MILAKELKQNWDSSEMIMFYHLFSLTDRQKRDIRNMFYKENLFFHICSPEVVKLAVRDTPFTSIQHLFESNTALLFSPDKDIDKILQLSKTTPNAILMAGIVENKFLSRTQLQKLNDALKTDGHQVLAQFLDSVPSHIVGTISHHQRMLTHLLSQVTNIKN